MTFARDSALWKGSASLPKMGFLLLILAMAITGLPKLRSTLQGGFRGIPVVAGEATDIEADGIDSIAVAENANAVTGDANLSERDQAPESLVLVPQTHTEKIEPAQEELEDVALDEQTRDLLSIVVDKSLRMRNREMPAYWELVRKTSRIPFQKLRESANSKISFNEFDKNSDKHRGELIALDVIVRRVTRLETEPDNKAGVKDLYEIWGSTEQSHAWLYVFITDALPEGVNEETILKKKMPFAGYFLKLMAYQPGNAAPNAKPLIAPLLIGRFDSSRETNLIEAIDPPWWANGWLSAFLVVAAAFLTLRVFLSASQPRKRTDTSRNLGNDFDSLWDEVNGEVPTSPSVPRQ